MFTGIVESAAAVRSIERTSDGARLVLNEVPFAGELAVGESVGVNGCCLTVVEANNLLGAVRFDLLGETLRVTSLGRLQPGSLVNLERALRVGDRLSGHILLGHVDCVSEVIGYTREGSDHRLEVALPRAFASLVIQRGSIGIDGISLTIAELGGSSFVCWIIPHTAAITALREVRAGSPVNLEFDVIGKYVARQREATAGIDGPIKPGAD